MEKLIEQLKALGVAIDKELIAQTILDQGMKADNLSNGDIAKLIRLLSQSAGGLSRIETPAPAMTKGGKGRGISKRQAVKAATPGDSIGKAKLQSLAEIEAMISGIEEQIDADNQAIAQHILTKIQNRPAEILTHLATEAERYTGDPEGFREVGRQFGAAFSVVSFSDEAESAA